MNEAKKLSIALPAVAALVAGCSAPQYEFDTDWHLSQEKVTAEQPAAPSGVPDLISTTAALPELAYEGHGDLYDVSVENVSVRQVLNSLADQSQLNLDVDSSVDGPISLSAYGQTLSELLERIRRQLPIRYERVGDTLVVMRDELYIKQYHINFPDLSRTYSGSSSTDVATSGSSSLGSASLSTTKNGSGSLWLDLEDAIDSVLTNLIVVLPQVSTAPAGVDEARVERQAIVEELVGREVDSSGRTAFVFTLPDAGLIVVYGNSEHHAVVSDMIGQVSDASRRQVLLQATVVEIQLNNQFQQGIDWSVFNASSSSPKLIQSAAQSYGPILGSTSTAEIEEVRSFYEAVFGEDEDAVNAAVSAFVDNAQGAPYFPPGSSTGGFINSSFVVGDLQFAISLLDTFGDTKVVSSPRISALNGQGAILKVVTDQIYFSLEVTRERDDAGVVTETYEVTEETVPIGFSVDVYPQIGTDGTIILSMKPSVSRVVGTATQPTVGTENLVRQTGVPIVSVKEIETLMLLQDGQTAVMGGLIEDQQLDNDTSVPGAASIPGIGNLFKNTDQKSSRVEYVIFVSAKIIENPSIYGDYSEFRSYLPSDETFRRDQTGSFFSRGPRSVPRSN